MEYMYYIPSFQEQQEQEFPLDYYYSSIPTWNPVSYPDSYWLKLKHQQQQQQRQKQYQMMLRQREEQERKRQYLEYVKRQQQERARMRRLEQLRQQQELQQEQQQQLPKRYAALYNDQTEEMNDMRDMPFSLRKLMAQKQKRSSSANSNMPVAIVQRQQQKPKNKTNALFYPQRSIVNQEQEELLQQHNNNKEQPSRRRRSISVVDHVDNSSVDTSVSEAYIPVKRSRVPITLVSDNKEQQAQSTEMENNTSSNDIMSDDLSIDTLQDVDVAKEEEGEVEEQLHESDISSIVESNETKEVAEDDNKEESQMTPTELVSQEPNLVLEDMEQDNVQEQKDEEEEKNLKKIQEISQCVSQLNQSVEQLLGQQPDSKQLRCYDELLTQQLLKLDAIIGSEQVRRLRRAEVQRIQSTLDKIDGLKSQMTAPAI